MPATRHPHEFSGGQRQRIGLARALALNPKLIVADEPVSALDVSIQAQILNLMKELQARARHIYVMVSHDLAVVYYMADTIGVMYLGKIVEIGDAESVFRTRRTPTPRGSSTPCRSPTPTRRRERGAQGRAASCRAPRTRRRAAGSARVPARPGHLCRARSRCTGRSARGTPPRATSRCATPVAIGAADAHGPTAAGRADPPQRWRRRTSKTSRSASPM